LPNGKVLVAGAFNFGYLASAELYDRRADLDIYRQPRQGSAFHTATLLPNGKVLVAAVTTGSPSRARSFTIGKWDLDSNRKPPTARDSHTATLLTDGQVLVAGGYLASAELYDPASETWATTGSLAMDARVTRRRCYSMARY